MQKSETTAHTQRMVRLPKVLEQVGVSRSCWYQGVKDGRYPKGRKIGPRAVAWLESDITALIASFPTAE